MIARTLREQVYEANLEIVRQGLVTFTWGNASGIDRDRNWIAIKPSGVSYNHLTPADMVLVDLDSGLVVDGALKPSSDTPTHLVLYRSFAGIGGVVHTHSRQATVWAQAGMDIPPFGTTHADYFHGSVPCTGPMDEDEVFGPGGYEHNTGVRIVRHFAELELDPMEMPAALVHGHGPFAWGSQAMHAAECAAVLEEVAAISLETVQLNPIARPISQHVLDKHFFRKHGPSAYYGQTVRTGELVHAH